MFLPERAIFEQDALEYPLGKEVMRFCKENKVAVLFTASHNRVTSIPGKTTQESYIQGKKTLVVGVRRTMDFKTCKPSAHYQMPLVTGCPGRCEYCYLLTNLGKKPYVRIYVNVDEILAAAGRYIEKRKPEITVFEGAATSDPVPVEPYTGSLRKAVEFFGRELHGRFRFVTKFTDLDTLFEAAHNKNTRIRFSINHEALIKQYEHATPALSARLAAAKRVAGAGYPIGFLVAPIILADKWKENYRSLFEEAFRAFKEMEASGINLTFEFITHRFTRKAKSVIWQIYPGTGLKMCEEQRTFKYGQFGYGKYVYPQNLFVETKAFFTSLVKQYFPAAGIDYFV